jgi:glycosyltransferase involved in cell wall biosynthesis
MNILFLNSIEKETYGGMEEWIRLAAKGLAQRGHDVTVAGRRGSEYLRRVSSTSPAVRTLELDISGDFNPVTISKLKKFLSANKTDVVIVNFNKDIRLGGLAARWEGSPCVIWSVGLDITKDNLVHRHLTPKLIDGVIVPSQALKRQITKTGYINESIVEVIPIGIGERDSVSSKQHAAVNLRRKYNLLEESIVAVTVGRFVEQKGHRYLIEAAAEIVCRHPKVIFLFLGDGPLREKLESQIAQLNLKKNFVLAGMLDDIGEELAGADLMIHPSVEEPFGIALLEGMRVGLPIVASRVGGIPEVVVEEETAMLFEPRNVEQLSAAVQELLMAQSKMEAFGLAGQQRWRSKFQLAMMIGRVEKCLTKFLKMASHSWIS